MISVIYLLLFNILYFHNQIEISDFVILLYATSDSFALNPRHIKRKNSYSVFRAQWKKNDKTRYNSETSNANFYWKTRDQISFDPRM